MARPGMQQRSVSWRRNAGSSSNEFRIALQPSRLFNQLYKKKKKKARILGPEVTQVSRRYRDRVTQQPRPGG